MQTAVEVGRGIDAAEEVSPGFKQAALSGELKARKSDLAALRNMEPEQRKDVAEAMRESPEKGKEAIERYKAPVKMEDCNATPLPVNEYTEDDFRRDVMDIPKELDDLIRLYLLVHGNMLESENCKRSFSDMLIGCNNIIGKYRRDYL